MKKLLKPISLAMTALLLLTSLSACAKTPTPDEIFTLVDEAESAKIVVKMEFAELMSATMTIEGEGNKSHVVTETEAKGMTSEEESYVLREDDKVYTYTKGADGKWTKEETDEEDDESSLESFKELFNTENYEEYDKESRRYVMKEDVEVEWDEMTCSEGYIEVGEDGTFKIYVELEQDVMGTKLSGSMTMKISKIGEVSVKLPDVD